MANYKLLIPKREWSLWSTEAIFSFPVKSILTNRDQKANHIFGINPKRLFFRLKSLFFQAVVLLVFRKCRKRQCLEGFFSSSKTRQGLKLTWICWWRVKYSIQKRKHRFLSKVYWVMFIFVKFLSILAVATVPVRLLTPLHIHLYIFVILTLIHIITCFIVDLLLKLFD